jgi:hypothetical protein
MKAVREYRRHADECDALARRAKTTEEREMIANMAATWRMLADQRKAMLLKRAREREAALQSAPPELVEGAEARTVATSTTPPHPNLSAPTGRRGE